MDPCSARYNSLSYGPYNTFLPSFLPTRKVKVLHLQGNQIGVAGIQALLSAGKPSAVEELRGLGPQVGLCLWG